MNDVSILSRIETANNGRNLDFSGRDVIAVFARAPIIGKVKTRLSRKIGAGKATLIYAAMLRDCLQLAAQTGHGTDGVLVCHTPPDAFDFEFQGGPSSLANSWSGARHAQCDGDLASRLLDCFLHLNKCGARKILIIGSDAPDVPVHYFHEAFDALDSHNLVFGPSDDGGFYLIGARTVFPELFQNVIWSSRSTLATILDNAERHNQRTALLDSWRDVDEIEDLHALISRLKLNSNAAPHTHGVLQSENLFES